MYYIVNWTNSNKNNTDLHQEYYYHFFEVEKCLHNIYNNGFKSISIIKIEEL